MILTCQERVLTNTSKLQTDQQKYAQKHLAMLEADRIRHRAEEKMIAAKAKAQGKGKDLDQSQRFQRTQSEYDSVCFCFLIIMIHSAYFYRVLFILNTQQYMFYLNKLN